MYCHTEVELQIKLVISLKVDWHRANLHRALTFQQEAPGWVATRVANFEVTGIIWSGKAGIDPWISRAWDGLSSTGPWGGTEFPALLSSCFIVLVVTETGFHSHRLPGNYHRPWPQRWNKNVKQGLPISQLGAKHELLTQLSILFFLFFWNMLGEWLGDLFQSYVSLKIVSKKRDGRIQMFLYVRNWRSERRRQIRSSHRRVWW